MAMCFTLRLAILTTLLISLEACDEVGFLYNGFQSANLSLGGIADITSNGLLKLTNETEQQKGHAFYHSHVDFKNSTNGSVLSFFTTFVFAIVPKDQNLGGQGIGFVIAPIQDLPGALPGQYLGLFRESNNSDGSNHVVAVELDALQGSQFADANDNHVGIYINGLKTVASRAGYHEDGSRQLKNLTLISGQQMQVWIEYHGPEKKIIVTLAPFNVPKPSIPLLSLFRDLSSIVNDEMHVGFTSSTGSFLTSHYILGWSFKNNGQAQELTLSELPKLPLFGPKKRSITLTIELPSILLSVMILAIVSAVIYFIRRKRKFAEVVEDWELEYGPHRFKFKDLYIATKGFKDKELLGAGGFGRVYRGVLPSSKLEVAVKRVSHESRQGMKEFVAEILTIGRLRHRNLVQLLGY